ncbi:Histidine phosphatase superfamily, clade-1 [Sesbania bispinosa]|nr:Histidine phosphatase superfamily, clade-1 [Sesbania bispinosa]
MDCGAAPSLFPLHRCKTIHLVRHAQGIHNVDGDKNYKAYLKSEYFDAHLTPLGWQQVDNLRKHVRASGLINRIDLVITSPLMRTLQTAVGVFGGEGYTGNSVDDVATCTRVNRGWSKSSLYKCRPTSREFIPVTEEEAVASISFFFLQLIFLWQIESDEDDWWKANVRETKEELAARGVKFMNWYGFANCELRSMVIVDRSMIGSEASTTNYPGKIPPGLDLPSDVADEKAEK